MENVKGLLSATLENERVFHRILDDLREPAVAAARDGRNGRHVRKGGYRIYSLTNGNQFENGDLEGSIIQAEKFGVPQACHRVILFGVRDDINGVTPGALAPQVLLTMARIPSRREVTPQSCQRALHPLLRRRDPLRQNETCTYGQND